MSYYKQNSMLLYRGKGNKHDQLITLTEIEEMYPFELTIYLILMNQKEESIK